MSKHGPGSRGGRKPGWLAVTVTLAGRPRTFAPGTWTCLVVAGLVPVLAVWYFAATLYLVFHDQLLASLIARQTDLQYAYEDRIAGLQTELMRQTSTAMVDRNTLETTVHDLQARSTVLEAHAVAIDKLVARSGSDAAATLDGVPPAASTPRSRTEARGSALAPRDRARARDGVPAYAAAVTPAEPPAPSSPLRLDGPLGGALPSPRAANADRRTEEADPSALGEVIGTTLSRVERDQVRVLTALREPTFRSLATLQAVLREINIPRLQGASVLPVGREVGGPFVPLSEDAGGVPFDQDLAFLDDALAQESRLNALVATVPLRKPMIGPLEVTSTFGPRVDPFLGRPALHTGIDFHGSNGDDVHATASGTVTIAATEGGYGAMVEVDHGNGLATRYAHLSSIVVAPNQKVAAGDIIGHVGSSGRATGPHLHYETRINGQPVDPARFLHAGAKLFDS